MQAQVDNAKCRSCYLKEETKAKVVMEESMSMFDIKVDAESEAHHSPIKPQKTK